MAGEGSHRVALCLCFTIGRAVFDARTAGGMFSIASAGRAQFKGIRMSKTRFKGSLLASTVIAGMAFAGPAYAQDAASQDATNQEQAVEIANPAERVAEEATDEPAAIVVTGSRIVRRDLDLDRPARSRPGRRIQAFGCGQRRAGDQHPAAGRSGHDLLLQQPGRRRSPPSTFAASARPAPWCWSTAAAGCSSMPRRSSISTRFPQFLIDSVDVVTGGASAVYGSDAIAGVVNFRLRNDLNGIEVGGGIQHHRRRRRPSL